MKLCFPQGQPSCIISLCLINADSRLCDVDIKESTKKPQRGMEFPTVNQMMVLSEVHTHGGFAKASRSMGTPDSYAKVTVSKLERKLGVQLTAPTGRGRAIEFTRVGEQIAQMSEEVVYLLQQIKRLVDAEKEIRESKKEG